MSPATHTLDSHHFALLDRIARRLAPGTPVDEPTRRAVSLLTAAADPPRADRLAVRPGEPAVLVQRLAVWALRRVPDDAVASAAAILDDDGAPTATSRPAHQTAQTGNRREVLVPCS